MARNTNMNIVTKKTNIKKNVSSADIQLKDLQQSQAKLQKHLDKLEAKLIKLQQANKEIAAPLRKELISGIKKLGERISQSITDVNERFIKLSEEIIQKVDAIKLESADTDKLNDIEPKYGEVKETELLELDDYEVVSKDAINRLLELSKQQSDVVRKFTDDQKNTMTILEDKVKKVEEDFQAISKKLENKITRRFVITLILLAATIISIIIYQLY